MSDLLSMGMINSLPHPLIGDFCNSAWPIYDIDVQTGLIRIDVCGLLEIKHFAEITSIIDANGKRHDADGFYVEGGE